MSKENVSIRIFGRDMTFSVSPKEKNDLIKSAEILNNELDNISDKSNALLLSLILSNSLLRISADLIRSFFSFGETENVISLPKIRIDTFSLLISILL